MSINQQTKNRIRVAEFESGAHRHTFEGQGEHQICLVLESDGGLIRQQRNGIVFEGTRRAGDIDIAPAFSRGHCHSEARQKFISVQLPSAIVTEVSQNVFTCDEDIQPTTRFAMRDEKLKHLITLLYAETHERQKEARDSSDDLMTASLTTALAIQLLRHHAHTRQHVVMQEPTCVSCGGLSAKAQQQILHYIEENLGNSVSLEAAASIVGLSRFHFLRAFKVSFGLTPHQYIIQQRINKAKTLMAQPQLTLREIAVRCGFSDQSHLTRHFRRLTGTTPKVFGDTMKK